MIGGCRVGHLLLRRQSRGATSEHDRAAQTANRLSTAAVAAILRIVLVVNEGLSVVNVRALNGVRLGETPDTLLAQVVTSLAVGLLRIHHVLQHLVLH